MPIVTVNDCGRGWNADLSPEELEAGMWSSVTNMRFLNGYAQRFSGTTSVFSAPSITPYWVGSYQTTTKKFWVHAGTQKVFVDDGTTRTEITPASLFTGTQDDRWTGGVLGGVLVMNNGVDQPQNWGGNVANDLATLTGWNSNWRCQSLVPFKNYLVALNITKTGTAYPHMVKWSHAAAAGTIPSSWDETDATKDAGEQDLAETADLLVDALPLGDTLAVYKERSCYEMRFVGQPFIFQFRRMPGEYGMLARGCGVNTPVGNVVLAAGDVILNTGQGMVSIADGLVRKYIFDNLSSDNYKRAFVTSNPQRNEVLICFPFAGSSYCNKACVWNWQTKLWGQRDLSNVTYGATGQLDYTTTSTWAADSEQWNWDQTTWTGNEYAPNEARLLLSTTTAIKAWDVGNSDDGTNALQGTLQRTGMSFGDPYTNKLVRAIRPRIDGNLASPITIRVGAAMNADQAPTWSSPVTFTVGSDIKADSFAQGRFVAVEFSASSPFRVRSFDLDVITTGAY
jgi:hypothetical protein